MLLNIAEVHDFCYDQRKRNERRERGERGETEETGGRIQQYYSQPQPSLSLNHYRCLMYVSQKLVQI